MSEGVSEPPPIAAPSKVTLAEPSPSGLDAPAPSRRPRVSRELAPRVLLTAAVAFNLVLLRAETSYVPLLNDGSMHAQMVRYAAAQFEAGHLPLGGWYPYLGLGSPQFLHYQSLPAMLGGLVGIVVGPDHAFNWATYLLWSTWPVSVYLGSRLFGWNRWVAAIAAGCAPLISSVPAIGVEPTAYLWIGYGVWAQLFATWTLPLAWGFSWRAIALRRPVWPAVLFISLTICLHYMTGYLAILAAPVWVVVKPSAFWPRLRRLALIGAATCLVSSWALLPLMLYGRWASINEFLQGTPSADSYGARRVLSWLVRGDVLDAGRAPIVTILVGLGFLEVLRRARTDERSRALAVIFCFSLALFFGRPTLGPLFDLLPRAQDLFLRRFIVGVQLSALMLAGVGAVALGDVARLGVSRWRGRHSAPRPRSARWVPTLYLGVVVAALAPGWTQLASYYRLDAADLAYQAGVDATAGGDVKALAATVRGLSPGRVYAGLPTNWGANFLVGDVPVFKYLSNLDLDVVGYTLRTASLMTNPEAHFDDTNPADYQIFGVRYLVLPPAKPSPVPARRVAQFGAYGLWEIPSVTGFFQVADTASTLTGNRSDIGANSLGFVDSASAAHGVYPTVRYAGAAAAPPTLGGSATAAGPPGSVEAQRDDLADGRASVVVSMNRTAVVVMKVSYDPGWQATLDGVPVSTQMIAPALLGVMVGPGTHVLRFHYVGYRHYLLLVALGAVALGLCIVGRRLTRRLATMERLGWLADLLSRALGPSPPLS